MKSNNFSHLMLVPTLACPAECKYCFGPHAGNGAMPPAALEAAARWAKRCSAASHPLEITFHGGEPLLPGARFYRQALPLLRETLAPRPVQFAVQSNLWFLSDELCELFAEYDVSVGTSLDGPEPITDAQRGAGYFRRTMAGIRRARQRGLNVGCICTFTSRSAAQVDEIVDFFLAEGLNFTVHAAVPPLERPDSPWALTPQAFGDLLLRLLELYLRHLDRLHIGTLDNMIRSISARQGGICTFSDCIGRHLAVDPQGWITPCQRWAGKPQFRLGNVHDNPSPDDLAQSPVWRMWREREERIGAACGDCPHLEICRGGCPYDALAANGGRWESAMRDPYCPAYRRFFDAVTEQALAEVFAEENLQAVVERGVDRYGLLQKGKLLTLMRGGPRPDKVQAQARRAVAAAALGVSGSLDEALDRLEQLGVVTNRQVARQSVTALEQQLRCPDRRLVNAYLHVTYACNLTCAHCYAEGSPARREAMTVEDVLRLAREAAQLGFVKVVITGGEPLAHPARQALLDGLAAIRPSIRPARLALRTNLAYPLTPELAARFARAADQVIVSVDGGQAAHDARRGAGTYARTVANLRRLREWAPDLPLMLAAVLTAAQARGPEGEAVRALGADLGAPVRIRPPLPLGRAAARSSPLEPHNSLEEEGTAVLAHQTHITSTCGLGRNIYIAPDGACYPCYALCGETYRLGNACAQSLKEVLESETFQQLGTMTVDATPHCRGCAWRYLCGGYCRAWRVGADLHAPPADCSPLRERAQAVLAAALETLGVPAERRHVVHDSFDHRTARLSDD